MPQKERKDYCNFYFMPILRLMLKDGLMVDCMTGHRLNRWRQGSCSGIGQPGMWKI